MRKSVKGLFIGALALTMLFGTATVASAKSDKIHKVPVCTETEARETETSETETTTTEAPETEAPETEAPTTEKPEVVKPGIQKPEIEKPETQKPAKKLISQQIAKVTCTASGKVVVSFKRKVTYTDALKVSIADADGKAVTCEIVKKTRSALVLSASGLVKGQKYTITIEGVQARNSKEAATITKTFVAKGIKTKCKVSKVTVTKNDVITIKTKSQVCYKDATVTVTDADGNTYAAKILRKSRNVIRIKVTGLEKGKEYTVTITGIKTKTEENYSSITQTIIAK